MNFDKTKRPVRLSEDDIQRLAFYADTHPERSDEAIILINRLLAEYHTVRKDAILAKARDGK